MLLVGGWFRSGTHANAMPMTIVSGSESACCDAPAIILAGLAAGTGLKRVCCRGAKAITTITTVDEPSASWVQSQNILKGAMMPELSLDFGLAAGESFEPGELDQEIDLTRPYIMTALGPIDPESAGFTLPHEHVFCQPPEVGDPDLLLDDPARSLAELEDAAVNGIRTIVDMTTADYGRSVDAIRWMSQRSPVHLVIATGHHKDLHAAPWLGDKTVDEIAATTIAELSDGIDGTDIRAGVIKAGTSLNAISDLEERVLKSAARSHLATGAPISTHTEKGTMALEQIAILTDELADPARIIIGHLDFALDRDYLLDVLATGVFVSFDQFSKTRYGSDEARAEMLLQLASSGHLSQLLVSGDLARKASLLSYGGTTGYRFLAERVPLLLMEAGFAATDVRTMMVDNPSRAFAIRPPIPSG